MRTVSRRVRSQGVYELFPAAPERKKQSRMAEKPLEGTGFFDTRLAGKSNPVIFPIRRRWTERNSRP